MAVAKADEESATIETPYVVQHGKEQIADAADAGADGGVVEDTPLLEGATADEARHEET